MNIRVVNIKTHGKPKEPWEVYIGRKNMSYGVGQSPLHNPPEFTRFGREGSIIKFREYFEAAYYSTEYSSGAFGKILAEMGRFRDILKQYSKLTLICWCSPSACHGDVIKEYLEVEHFEVKVL